MLHKIESIFPIETYHPPRIQKSHIKEHQIFIILNRLEK